MKNNKLLKFLLITASHILVAALAVTVTLLLWKPEQPSKLDELEELIQEKFIGEADLTKLEAAILQSKAVLSDSSAVLSAIQPE